MDRTPSPQKQEKTKQNLFCVYNLIKKKSIFLLFRIQKHKNACIIMFIRIKTKEFNVLI